MAKAMAAMMRAKRAARTACLADRAGMLLLFDELWEVLTCMYTARVDIYICM